MKRILLLFCLSLLTLAGCEKEFVETAPENLYSAITVYKTPGLQSWVKEPEYHVMVYNNTQLIYSIDDKVPIRAAALHVNNKSTFVLLQHTADKAKNTVFSVWFNGEKEFSFPKGTVVKASNVQNGAFYSVSYDASVEPIPQELTLMRNGEVIKKVPSLHPVPDNSSRIVLSGEDIWQTINVDGVCTVYKNGTAVFTGGTMTGYYAEHALYVEGDDAYVIRISADKEYHIWKNGEKIDETYPAPDKDTDSVHRNNGQFFFTANHQGRTYAVRNKEIDKYSWYFFAIRWVDNDVYSISCDGNLFYLYQNHRPLYMLPLEDAGHWKLDLNSVCLTSN
jgi:hypothetical protein